MDEYIKQSVESRKNAITNAYELSATDAKRVDELFSKIEALAKKCKDVNDFESQFAASPLNQEYMGIFGDLAQTSKLKGAAAAPDTSKVINDALVNNAVSGAADTAMDRIERAVLPTRASVNQAGHDAMQRVPVLGDVLDINQKAGYAAHRGKLFKGKKKDKKEEE